MNLPNLLINEPADCRLSYFPSGNSIDTMRRADKNRSDTIRHEEIPMKELLTSLEVDWAKFKGRREIEIMDKYAIVGRRLTLSYAGFLYGSMMPFMIIPAVPIFINIFGSTNVTQVKELMFRVDFFLDAEKYYWPLLIHSYICTMAFITVVVAIDTMFMTHVQHACGCFAVLGWINLIIGQRVIPLFSLRQPFFMDELVGWVTQPSYFQKLLLRNRAEMANTSALCIAAGLKYTIHFRSLFDPAKMKKTLSHSILSSLKDKIHFL